MISLDKIPGQNQTYLSWLTNQFSVAKNAVWKTYLLISRIDKILPDQHCSNIDLGGSEGQPRSPMSPMSSFTKSHRNKYYRYMVKQAYIIGSACWTVWFNTKHSQVIKPFPWQNVWPWQELNLHSTRRDSNPQCSDPKSNAISIMQHAALPIELHGR